MRPAVVPRRQLMQFEIVLQWREDAANDTGKTGRGDRVADDQNPMQAFPFPNPTAEIRRHQMSCVQARSAHQDRALDS